MTKQEFIDKVAEKSGLCGARRGQGRRRVPRDDHRDAEGPAATINFTGFGKFSTQHRAARLGVNPRNPTEKVTIPATIVPKFSAGSPLKAAVSGR